MRTEHHFPLHYQKAKIHKICNMEHNLVFFNTQKYAKTEHKNAGEAHE
jgi:hypothetical protein